MGTQWSGTGPVRDGHRCLIGGLIRTGFGFFALGHQTYLHVVSQITDTGNHHPHARLKAIGYLDGVAAHLPYLDRMPVAQIETKANHHVPMFMILNLTIGGRWPGSPDPSALPAHPG